MTGNFRVTGVKTQSNKKCNATLNKLVAAKIWLFKEIVIQAKCFELNGSLHQHYILKAFLPKLLATTIHSRKLKTFSDICWLKMFVKISHFPLPPYSKLTIKFDCDGLFLEGL